MFGGEVLLKVLDVVFVRRFLVSVCDVAEPEEQFGMDEFSDLLIVHRPVIYISVSELLNTHKVRDPAGPGPRPLAWTWSSLSHRVFVSPVAVGAPGGPVFRSV